jgi:hypothetical protein
MISNTPGVVLAVVGGIALGGETNLKSRTLVCGAN